MRINTFYKWTMLLFVAWFYGGEAKAQFQAEAPAKEALYGDNQPGWNSLTVSARNIGLGIISHYECAVGPEGYVAAEADFSEANCGTQGAGSTRVLTNIPNIQHGINVVWFRAVARVLLITLQPPYVSIQEERSAPGVVSWFVDAQIDLPIPQYVDVNGEVVLIADRPGGTCNPVVVPIVVENGSRLNYRVGNGPVEALMTPVPVPESPPYLSDYNLQLDGYSLNEGESLELYVWLAYDRFGHHDTAPAIPWIVRCQPPPPLPAIAVDTPVEGATYAALAEATGIASADVTEVVLCLDGQTGAECTPCTVANEA
ncbi:MAG: hypothetical protein FWC18_06195, partial [Cystobacterineae bacterium]|nr:hypothetical protein [Cystobacterineae bacterium]MCL2259396.1 hypothetical protein [Cystobacterineae bacterium]